jgi:hypothetical protein
MGQIMNNLEQYLKTASRGTYGKTRVLIRAELEANIRIRSKELEHHGLTETQAINRALEELGTPNFVSTGMTGVYTMKTFKKAVLPLSITAALFAATLPFGVAQIQAVIPNFGKWLIYDKEERAPFLSLYDLKHDLEKAGVKVQDQMQTINPSEIPQSEIIKKPYPEKTQTLSFDLENSSQTIEIKALPGFSIQENGLEPQFLENESVYVAFYYLLAKLRSAHVPITLKGWKNPQLQIGQVILNLGTNSSSVDARPFYADALTEAYFLEKDKNPDQLPQTSSFTLNEARDNRFKRHTIRVKAETGAVFALLTNLNTSGIKNNITGEFLGYNTMHTSFARVNASGMLEFYAPWNALEFVRGYAELSADFKLLEKIGRNTKALAVNKLGSSSQPAKALLIRMTGRLDDGAANTELAFPMNSRSNATK